MDGFDLTTGHFRQIQNMAGGWLWFPSRISDPRSGEVLSQELVFLSVDDPGDIIRLRLPAELQRLTKEQLLAASERPDTREVGCDGHRWLITMPDPATTELRIRRGYGLAGPPMLLGTGVLDKRCRGHLGAEALPD